MDAEDELERKRTRYVLREGALALLLAALRMLLTRPVRLMRALALAWRMSRGAERPLPVHLAYLAEACRIEPWLRAAGVQHLHAHFGTNSAEVAMLVHALGGPALELHRARAGGIRQGAADRPGGEGAALRRSWWRSAPTAAASSTAWWRTSTGPR